jgi:hypothetical protein
MLLTTACPEQQRLRDRYQTAIRAYKEMISALDGVSSHREFDEVYERAEGVRLFDVAREEHRKHLLLDGCLVSGTAGGALLAL